MDQTTDNARATDNLIANKKCPINKTCPYSESHRDCAICEKQAPKIKPLTRRKFN